MKHVRIFVTVVSKVLGIPVKKEFCLVAFDTKDAAVLATLPLAVGILRDKGALIRLEM